MTQSEDIDFSADDDVGLFLPDEALIAQPALMLCSMIWMLC